MGNNCVGSLKEQYGYFQSSLSSGCFGNDNDNNKEMKNDTKAMKNDTITSKLVQNQPPKTPIMSRNKILDTTAEDDDVITDRFVLGRKLGFGQYGTTYSCTEKTGGKTYACKSIQKASLETEEEAEAVRNEVRAMRHLAGLDWAVAGLKWAGEDDVAVHIVMEICSGGELFDRISARGRYAETEALRLVRAVIRAVDACHVAGVMHRDLKPENFLFVHSGEESPLKLIDFGMSVFFEPGQVFTEAVGSPFYVAPEILLGKYGPEADIWSVGVIIYILLCGVPPFFGDSLEEIYEEILHSDLDFSSDPWPTISESAKDLIKKILVRDPKKRLTAQQILCHPWLRVDKIEPEKSLYPVDKPNKLAPKVITKSLSEKEIAGLREMFRAIDAHNSDEITFEELKSGIKRFGANLRKSESELMQSEDIDNSGSIECGEFIGTTLHLTSVKKDDHLATAFLYFDKERIGYITQDELRRACEDFGINDDCDFDEIIQQVDRNNDGRIDYNEFVSMMQKGKSVDLGKIGLLSRNTSFSVGFREALSVC